ncbi:MAG: nucleotidyltransferase family protein [Tannerellaceae bacterium]|jgi:NDP-sugar pyrophosphorylase family protein|nr:nucleotidyltransferase family protein [Tannerellaceae bacterium]
MKAMILAAGIGQRLQPLTLSTPKALIPLNGKPVLAHVIERLKAVGCNEIIINVHHHGDQIIDYLRSQRSFGIDIHISDERNYLLDTGGGLKQAAGFFSDSEPFLLHNVDIITDVNLKGLLDAHKPEALATLFVSRRTTSRYLLFDRNGLMFGWRNRETNEVRSAYPDFEPDTYHEYAFNGIHLVSPKIFNLMDEWTGKFSIIQFYIAVCARHKIYAWLPDKPVLFDVGKPEGLASAERWMKNIKR